MDSLSNQFQEPFVVHLLVGNVFAIVEYGIGGDGRWGVLSLLLALQTNGFERILM